MKWKGSLVLCKLIVICKFVLILVCGYFLYKSNYYSYFLMKNCDFVWKIFDIKILL